MPSWPGVLPVIAHAHAGTVIGGVMLSRLPYMPASISARMFGISSSRSRNSNCGVPQSRPMSLLRRVLYWHATVWTACGIAIAVVPRWVLVTLFDQPAYPQYAYVRV